MDAKQTVIFAIVSVTAGFIASGVVIWKAISMLLS